MQGITSVESRPRGRFLDCVALVASPALRPPRSLFFLCFLCLRFLCNLCLHLIFSVDNAIIMKMIPTIQNLTTGHNFELKPLGDVAEILKAGNVFEYARQTGLIES